MDLVPVGFQEATEKPVIVLTKEKLIEFGEHVFNEALVAREYYSENVTDTCKRWLKKELGG